MVKPKYLIGIFIGILFVYLAVAGPVVPNLFSTSGTTENYLTYTKVDPNGHISVAANTITQTVTRSESAYVYADKGAGYFTDFTHTVDFEVTSGSTSSMGFVWGLDNSVGDLQSIRGGNDLQVAWVMGAGSFSIFLRTWVTGAASPNGVWTTLTYSVSTWYYLTIAKSGTHVTCTIYSDAARTSSKEALSITMAGTTPLRYVYACSTNDDPLSGYTGSQVVANLNLGVSVVPPPTTGTLRVFASYDGTFVPVYVTVSSSPAQFGTTTTDADAPLAFSLAAGTYTVSGTYSGVYQSGSGTVVAGDPSGPAQVVLNFGGSVVVPPSGGSWLDFFKNSTVKSALLLLGIAFIGIFGLLSFIPFKKRVPIISSP